MDPIITTNYFAGSPHIAGQWFAIVGATILGLFVLAACVSVFSSESKSGAVGKFMATIGIAATCAFLIAGWVGTVNLTQQTDRDIRSILREDANIENFKMIENSGGRSFIGTTRGGQSALCTAFDIGLNQNKISCSS